MTHPIEDIFRHPGLLASSPATDAGHHDETLAAYLEGRLPSGARRRLEREALADPTRFELLRASVDAVGGPARRPFLVLARLKDRGLELLNEVDLTLRSLFEPQPALGALRRHPGAAEDLVALAGPGEGIDELDLQVLPDHTARVVVRCTEPLDLRVDESVSITLDTDGELREKHPFDGDSFTFSALQPGHHVVRLMARSPGRETRTLAEAAIDLTPAA
jgi:hypothetical protein